MDSNSRVGEIVLIYYPQANARGSKVRPAVIVFDNTTSGFGTDVTLAHMTTEVDNYAYDPASIILERNDLEFGWIKDVSVVRTDKLSTADSRRFIRNNVAKLKTGKIRKLLKSISSTLVANYYQAIHKPGQDARFLPGASHINYAGRVFDEKEMINLTDSALDFWLTSGKYASRFEEGLARKLGVRHCSLVNSGSSANLVAVMALTSSKLGELRLRKGDEVITVAAGFPTTIAPILQAGAVPVFVDVRLADGNVAPDLLEQAKSAKTKAVILAHTLGFPFDIEEVKAFCDSHGLWLIEDNCDALGSRVMVDGAWQYTGTIGHMGTSSFYPPHHLTMGEGGAVYTNDLTLKRIIESLRDWGRDCWCASGQDNSCQQRFAQQFGTLPAGYDHKYVYSHFGYNLKATEMQAAIGCAQLLKLDQFTKKRQANHQRLLDGLEDLSGIFHLPDIARGTDPSPFGFLLTIKGNAGLSRNEATRYLEGHNIQTRNLFAGDITRQPCFDHLIPGTDYRCCGTLSNTEVIMKNAFWLGVYPGMSDDMLGYMIQCVHDLSGMLKH